VKSIHSTARSHFRESTTRCCAASSSLAASLEWLRFGPADCLIGTTGPPQISGPTGRRLSLPSRARTCLPRYKKNRRNFAPEARRALFSDARGHGSEKVLVVKGHCERENGRAVTIMAHAHHDARSVGAECGMPGADRHAPRRGGRSFDVREVDFDVRPAGLGKVRPWSPGHLR